MEQWVGILLGFIVAIAIIIAYMYRRSNFENATSAPPQDALVVTGVVETPGAPVQPSPSPTAQPPTMMPTQAETSTTMMPTQPPTMMPTQAETSTTMMPTQPPTMMPTQPPTMMPQTTAPTMMSTQPPTMMSTQSEMDIEPAYDAKFAEYSPEDDIKVM